MRSPPFSIERNKIPLAEQATSGNLPPQQKAVGMPEIKVVTEVAGRVCALPIEAGADVSDGDDLAFVEAMKMEIPVASPAAGVLKLLLVAIDDVVTEVRSLPSSRPDASSFRPFHHNEPRHASEMSLMGLLARQRFWLGEICQTKPGLQEGRHVGGERSMPIFNADT